MNREQARIIQKRANQLGEEKNFTKVQRSGRGSLQMMRRNSHYPASRAFARIVYLFFTIILAIMLIVAVAFAVMEGEYLTSLGIILGCLFVYGFIHLMYESLQLITDIADSSVTQVELLRQIDKRQG